MATSQAYKRNIRDRDLKVVTALPATASATVNGSAIDMGAAGFAKAIDRSCGGRLDAVVNIPALSTTILPDTRTLTVVLEHAATNFGTATTIGTLVITGAGGVGAAAAELRVIVPNDCGRYLRAHYTLGASTTDASALSGTFELVI